MNHRASLAFLCLFVFSGSLCAEEERPWSHWTQVGGEIVGDRGAFVRSRSRRDPAKDDEGKGYAFEYELHNEGNTLTARVSLWHAVRDPASGRWLELDRSGPASTSHDVPPLETVRGTAFAPSVRGLYFESDIKWVESAFELTGEKNFSPAKKPDEAEPPTTKKPDEAEPPGPPTADEPAPPALGTAENPIRYEISGGSGGYTSSLVPNVIFRLPLDSKVIVDEYERNWEHGFPPDSEVRVRATIKVTRPAKFNAASPEYQGWWAENQLASLKTDEKFGNLLKLRILSQSNQEIRYAFEATSLSTVTTQLFNQNDWGTVPEEIVVLSYKPPEPPKPEPEPAPEPAAGNGDSGAARKPDK